MSGGGKFTVEISRISDISAAEIEVHFQEKKYGGGDVTVKDLEDGKAFMIIEGITSESKVDAIEKFVMNVLVNAPPMVGRVFLNMALIW